MRSLLITSLLTLLACAPPPDTTYTPPPMLQPQQPPAPTPQLGSVRGQVRVFTGASAANASGREVPEVLKAFRARSGSVANPPTMTAPVEAPKVDRPTPPRAPRIIAGSLIVGLVEPMDVAVLLRVLNPERHGWRCREDVWASETMVGLRCTHVDGSPLTVDETVAATDLLGLPSGVRFIEANRVATAQRVPNDPSWTQQWHYRAMGLPAAWDVSTGSSDVVVAVLDTGISNHPDLVGNLLPGIDLISDVETAADGNGRDDDATDVLGNEDPRADGSSWHGTHVAGTIAATSDNGVGVAGVAWNARVVAVRVLGRGGGSNLDIVAGITWASGATVPGSRANTRPANVVNMSLGGDGAASQAYQTAIDAAVARGVVVVVAAGNEDENTANKTPCNQANVICVGATDLRGKATGYTNFGSEVTISAPGGATDRDDDGDGKPDGVLSTIGGGGYARMQGTSMATPHVAGLVALMKSMRPTMTHAQVRDALVASATPISNCATACGKGIVDAARVMAGLSAMSSGGRLSVSATSVVLTENDNEAQVRLSNVGTGPLVVSFVGPAGQAEKTLWTASAYPLPLSAGASETVKLSWSGGFASDVDVPMKFRSAAGDVECVLRVRKPRPTPRTEVMLAWFANGKWNYTARSFAFSDGSYHLRNVAPGDYYLVAFADDDGDGLYEDGESVGMWPNLENPAVLSIASGTNLEWRDFTVAPTTPVTTIGGACQTEAQCSAGEFCATNLPGGSCSKSCATESCGAGAVCLTFSSGTKYCVAPCANPGSRDTCRAGYVCTALTSGNGGVCLEP